MESKFEEIKILSEKLKNKFIDLNNDFYPVEQTKQFIINNRRIMKNNDCLFIKLKQYLLLFTNNKKINEIIIHKKSKINNRSNRTSNNYSLHSCPKYSSVILQILICLSTFLFFGASAVRLVALNVPEQVRRGGDAELQCLYDLGEPNASLYSLKWFWRANDTDLDEKEFYRFTPTIQPHKQFFPLDGIHVNINKTDGGRLWLVNVNSRTSGRFKCEISVEGTFQTVAEEKRLSVLDFWDFFLPKSISRIGSDEFDEDNEINFTARTTPIELLFKFIIVTIIALINNTVFLF